MSFKLPIYRLYLDESGTPSYEDCGSTDRQFLCITGVIISLEETKQKLFPALEQLKDEFFPSHHPDHPVILHRDEIVKKSGSFWPLRDDVINKKWEERIIKILEETEFRCISVVINKTSYKSKYGNAAHHPYLFVLNVILERYIKFLEDKNENGDVMAESRGGNEDMKLKGEYKSLYSRGTYYDSPIRFQNCLTSKEIKIKNKNQNVSGLQLADLICHPLKYLILRGYKKCENKSGNYAKRVCKTLIEKNKLFKSTNRKGISKITGFGIKYLE
jgi:hypothetical protein